MRTGLRHPWNATCVLMLRWSVRSKTTKTPISASRVRTMILPYRSIMLISILQDLLKSQATETLTLQCRSGVWTLAYRIRISPKPTAPSKWNWWIATGKPLNLYQILFMPLYNACLMHMYEIRLSLAQFRPCLIDFSHFLSSRFIFYRYYSGVCFLLFHPYCSFPYAS